MWWNLLLKLKADKIWDELRPVFIVIAVVFVVVAAGGGGTAQQLKK